MELNTAKESHPGFSPRATTQERVKGFVERVQRLEEEKVGLSADIKAVFDEAAGEGFDKKALKEVIKRLKQAADERTQFEELVDLYMAAVGEPKQGALPI